MTGLETAHGTMSNNELTAKRAQDSMSIVAMALYNLPSPDGDPGTANIFLPHRTSRMTIMRVRMMLSESEIE